MASPNDQNEAELQVQHRFGGGWTEVKLRAVSDYLQFFTKALKEQPRRDNPFKLWYIDAFAGTGERTVAYESNSLFENEQNAREMVKLQGSARRAIDVEPRFKHLVFIEKDTRRYTMLDRIRIEHPDRDIRCYNGDANVLLYSLFRSSPWIGREASLQRAVVFLDPYGMSVKWATLQHLAATKRVDVWYLFPLHAVLRQLAHDHEAIDGSKRGSLTEIFGTDAWEAQFYQFGNENDALFGDLFEQKISRAATANKVEKFAVERLRSIFPFVSSPIPILTRRRLRQFSLFCLSANPSPKAIDLIKRGVSAQLKKYGRSINE